MAEDPSCQPCRSWDSGRCYFQLPRVLERSLKGTCGCSYAPHLAEAVYCLLRSPASRQSPRPEPDTHSPLMDPRDTEVSWGTDGSKGTLMDSGDPDECWKLMDLGGTDRSQGFSWSLEDTDRSWKP